MKSWDSWAIAFRNIFSVRISPQIAAWKCLSGFECRIGFFRAGVGNRGDGFSVSCVAAVQSLHDFRKVARQMGRYTGPKGRINRRLGVNVYESAGSIRALERKEFPPGMHRRRKKPTNYGIGLAEKQKIKFFYGLRDRQLNRYFDKARHLKGNTGQQLLVICERRLDNVVRRAGFAMTRPQARQGIVHRHFQLNGVTVNKPGIMVKAGDVITVRKRPNIQTVYKGITESSTLPQTEWINFEPAELRAVVTTLPTFDDVTLVVDVGAVVAFLSR